MTISRSMRKMNRMFHPSMINDDFWNIVDFKPRSSFPRWKIGRLECRDKSKGSVSTTNKTQPSSSSSCKNTINYTIYMHSLYMFTPTNTYIFLSIYYIIHRRLRIFVVALCVEVLAFGLSFAIDDIITKLTSSRSKEISCVSRGGLLGYGKETYTGQAIFDVFSLVASPITLRHTLTYISFMFREIVFLHRIESFYIGVVTQILTCKKILREFFSSQVHLFISLFYFFCFLYNIQIPIVSLRRHSQRISQNNFISSR